MKQLAIVITLSVCCAASADKPRPQQIAGQRINPKKFCRVMLVNGRLFQVGDWIPYVPGSASGDGDISSAACQTVGYSPCGASRLVFDMFEPDVAGGFPSDGPGSTGPVADCGLGGNRWFYGAAYLNPYTANDMTVCAGAAGAPATAVDLAWYWGDAALRDMQIAVLTSDSFDDTCVGPPTGAVNGWAIDFGQNVGGGGFYFYSNVDFCGAATWALPASGSGAYQIWMGSLNSSVFTLDGALGTQPMLWGTDSERPGAQGPIEWDDDNPADAVWTAPTECYDYTFSLCPNPLGAMIAFRTDGACIPCDTNCDGSVNQFDIQSFIIDLTNGGGGCSPCAADTNGDGSINQFDIGDFVFCMAGSPDPNPQGDISVYEDITPEPCPITNPKPHIIKVTWFEHNYKIDTISILKNGQVIATQAFGCAGQGEITVHANLSPGDEIQTTVTTCQFEGRGPVFDEVKSWPIAGATYMGIGGKNREDKEQRTLTCVGCPANSQWIRVQTGDGEVVPNALTGVNYPITATHESTPLDDLTIYRSHQDADGDTSVSASLLTIVRFTLREVAYGGPAFSRVAMDAPDPPFADYSSPEWVDLNGDWDADDPGESKFPVSFKKNNAAGVQAVKFKAVPPNLPDCAVMVKGVGPNGENFDGVGHITGDDLAMVGTVVGSVPLPNEVKVYEPYTVQWSVKYADAKFCASGISDNLAYITLLAPVNERLETYYDIGTRAAQGCNAVDTTIAAVWNRFKGRHVETVRHEVMGYYRGASCPNDVPSTNAPRLVALKNGQCGAWVDLMIQVLRTQGIEGADVVTIVPRTDNLPADCTGSGPDGFIIKEYTFAAAGTSGCANYPFKFNDPCGIFTSWPAGQVEVTNAAGKPGQDENDPASWFVRHFIVKINGIYYDPSYGDPSMFPGPRAAANLAWEQGAVAGYYGDADVNHHQGVRADIPGIRETNFDR